MPRNEKRLDAFTRAYIEAMLWSSMDNTDEQGGEPLDANYGPEDIAPETMELIVEDCSDFQERYADLLVDSGINYGRAGHCFWLSREGHGSGFFDEDTIDEEFRDPLQEAAESYGSFDLQVDDGVIYGPPVEWYRSHHHRDNVERLTGKPASPYAKEVRRTPRVADERYQGWANWETWNVALWFGNDRGLYDAVRGHHAWFTAASAEALTRDILPNGTQDFRGRGGRRAYAKVDWREIADDFNEMRGGKTEEPNRARRRRSLPRRR
jgi:hypothetical protein